MANDKNNGPFDDLFEPFELEEFPSDTGGVIEMPSAEAPVVAALPRASFPVGESTAPAGSEQVPTVRCPSCGSLNPAHNRHCEECGARLAQGPLPVAPPPMVRSTPGGRALGILLAVLAIVALFTLFLNIFRGGDGDEVAATTTIPTTTTAAPEPQTQLQPVSVAATSELGGFPATNLIDGDVSSYWNDSSQRGVGAVLTFTFAQPVKIGEMELVNIPDDAPFRRNYRIRDFQVTVDDLAIEFAYRMPDNNDPQRFELNTLETRRVTITILETYVGEPVGDLPSFTELALAEIRFYGSVNN